MQEGVGGEETFALRHHLGHNPRQRLPLLGAVLQQGIIDQRMFMVFETPGVPDADGGVVLLRLLPVRRQFATP